MSAPSANGLADRIVAALAENHEGECIAVLADGSTLEAVSNLCLARGITVRITNHKECQQHGLRSHIVNLLGLPSSARSNLDAFDESFGDREFRHKTPTILIVDDAARVLRNCAHATLFLRNLEEIREGRLRSNYAALSDQQFPAFWVVLGFVREGQRDEWLNDCPGIRRLV